MFLDIVGIVIAFSVVMLLLSLIVTALGQATQATLRLRGRNLQTGLAIVFEPDISEESDRRRLAAKVLHDADVAPLDRSRKPESARAKFFGPAVSWLEAEKLGAVLTKISDRSPASVEPTVQRFRNMEKSLSKRFAFIMRCVAIFWALAVAMIFQISTPQLIKDLSTDRDLRAEYIAIAPAALDLAGDTLTLIEEYEPIYQNALNAMAERYPDLAGAFSQVNTETPYLGDVSEELSDILDGAENQDQILVELENMLYADVRRHRDAMLAQARASQEQLSLINITPYRYGNEFYLSHGRIQIANILGVLMTMILVMLGAQFWFNTLKTAVSFRDILAPLSGRRASDRQRRESESGGDT